jgi:hypothetical protein
MNVGMGWGLAGFASDSHMVYVLQANTHSNTGAKIGLVNLCIERTIGLLLKSAGNQGARH